MFNFPPADVIDARLRQLVDAVIEHRATDNELREMDTLLKANKESIDYYVAMLEMHVELLDWFDTDLEWLANMTGRCAPR